MRHIRALGEVAPTRLFFARISCAQGAGPILDTETRVGGGGGVHPSRVHRHPDPGSIGDDRGALPIELRALFMDLDPL